MVPEWLRERREDEQEMAEERTLLDYTPGILLSSSRSKNDMAASSLTRDVAFNRHSMNDGHHVSPADNGQVQVGTDGIIVKLVQGIDEAAFRRTLSMAVRATIGVDLNQPLPGDWEPCEVYKREARKAGGGWMDFPPVPVWVCGHHSHRKRAVPSGERDEEGYTPWVYEGQVSGADWEEMLKGGLQTALESQVIVFAVSGVSRTATHQIVRTRKAAFHQQSQRASYMGDQPEVRMPESVWRNRRARNAFLDALKEAQQAYRIACEEDISYQDARFILPEGTTNYIMMEYSLREFLNVYAYRGCSMFQWEIVYIMREARRLLVEAYPWLDPHLKISCEKTSGAGDYWDPRANATAESGAHTCTFQGWERVEGQCDFPWARDSNRTFRSEAHEIGRIKEQVAMPVTGDVTIPEQPTTADGTVQPDQRPHSRACGIRRHDHGPDCFSNCPTCHGQPERSEHGGMAREQPLTDHPHGFGGERR